MAHVAIMIRIIPSENRNMYFRMIQDSDTTFKVEMGRVGDRKSTRLNSSHSH